MFAMPVIDMTATGMNIIKLRKAAGLTVKDLQEIFGFATPQAIYKWQHGTDMPTIDNLVVLGAVFGVPVDDIIVVDVHDIISTDIISAPSEASAHREAHIMSERHDKIKMSA